MRTKCFELKKRAMFRPSESCLSPLPIHTPQLSITGRSEAVLLLWLFNLTCCYSRVYVVSNNIGLLNNS